MSELKAIKTGHEKLQEEVEFWAGQIDEDRNHMGTKWNLDKCHNAQRALSEFVRCYSEQLIAIKKWPFLAK